MGAAAITMSSNTSNITNNMINDISNSMTKNCASNSIGSQTIKVILKNMDKCSGDLSGFYNGMNSTVSLDCAQSSVTSTNLEAALKNAIDQLATSTKSAGTMSLVDITTTKNFIDLKNAVTNKNTINNLMNAINNSTKSQTTEIIIDGFRCYPVTTRDIYGRVTTTGDKIKIGNITQQMTSNVVAKVLQNSDDLVKALIAVDNDISQVAKSTNKGLFESLGDMMTGFASSMVVLIILICAVGAVAAYVMKGGGTPYGPQNGTNVPVLKKTGYTCMGGIFLCSVAFAISLYATLSQKAYADKMYARSNTKENKDALDAQFRPMILSYVGGGLIGIIAIMTIIVYLFPSIAKSKADPSKVSWTFILVLIFIILASLALCCGAIADEVILVGAQNDKIDGMINKPDN